MQNGCGGCQLRIWRKQAVERTTKNVQRVTAPDCKKNTGNRKSEILASAHKISNAWPWPACAILGRGPPASVGLGFGRAISSPQQHHVMLRPIILVLMERQIASGWTICLNRSFDRVPLRCGLTGLMYLQLLLTQHFLAVVAIFMRRCSLRRGSGHSRLQSRWISDRPFAASCSSSSAL
jgi:hypothetical protein